MQAKRASGLETSSSSCLPLKSPLVKSRTIIVANMGLHANEYNGRSTNVPFSPPTTFSIIWLLLSRQKSPVEEQNKKGRWWIWCNLPFHGPRSYQLSQINYNSKFVRRQSELKRKQEEEILGPQLSINFCHLSLLQSTPKLNENMLFLWSQSVTDYQNRKTTGCGQVRIRNKYGSHIKLLTVSQQWSKIVFPYWSWTLVLVKIITTS